MIQVKHQIAFVKEISPVGRTPILSDTKLYDLAPPATFSEQAVNSLNFVPTLGQRHL